MANNIPQLRFSEFSEDWEEKRLEEYFEFKNGVNASKEDYGSGYKFINVLDIINNDFITNEKIIGKVNISKEMFQKNIVKYGNILFQRSSETREEVGQSNVYLDKEKDSTFGGFVIRGKGIVDYVPSFMNLLLKTSKARKEITTKSGGSTRYNVGQETLKKVKIQITTSLPEQTKIATFLTAVDKRINLLQKKKAELEQYKKGIMQKLFSVKTDGNPSLRFKKEDGSDFEDWEEQSLGQIGETFNGLTGKTKVDFGKGKPYVQYMQIFSNSRIDIANFGLVDVGDDENQSKAQFGDVFFTTSSETPNEIGMSSVLTEQVEDVYLNSFCFGYRPNSLEELIPEFSQFFFRSSKVRKEIIKLAQGSTRFNMSKVAFMKLKFNFPKKNEQQKIATFLSSIDKSIDNMTNQIDDSIVFKKGLLQKMFV